MAVMKEIISNIKFNKRRTLIKKTVVNANLLNLGGSYVDHYRYLRCETCIVHLSRVFFSFNFDFG